MSLFAELQRRRVFRVLVGYGVVAFGVLQAIEPIMHALHLPDAVLTYTVIGLGLGFPVALVLGWAFDVTPDGVERTGQPGLRGTRLWLSLVGLGLLAAAPGMLWYLWPRAAAAPVAISDESLKSKLDAAPPASDIRAPPSIGVLPFADMSPGKDQEYFADGLAEELLNLLAKVPGLHVAARTSAFSFKGRNDDVRAIAKALGVGAVLEGSVRKAGEQVRITAQLINAADGFHLWSETYDRKLTDVFAVQDEIAGAVVAALKLKLLPAQAPSGGGRRTTSPEVYTQFLLGKQLAGRAAAMRTSGWEPAVRAFEQVVAQDPGFVPGWAALARAQFWAADSAGSVALIESGQRAAVEAAEKAVALGPDVAEAYGARGWIRRGVQRDFEGSRADFQRALALEPGSSENLSEYGVVLSSLGKRPEAVAALTKATQLDPLNAPCWNSLGSVLGASGRLAEARTALDRSLEIDPQQQNANIVYGRLELRDGKFEAALARFERSPELFRVMGRALCFHSLGRGAESKSALEQMIAAFGHGGAFQIAEVYAWRGEKDLAFEWLEKAWAQHDAGIMLVKSSYFLRSLHGDPRYRAWLSRVKLPLD